MQNKPKSSFKFTLEKSSKKIENANKWARISRLTSRVSYTIKAINISLTEMKEWLDWIHVCSKNFVDKVYFWTIAN